LLFCQIPRQYQTMILNKTHNILICPLEWGLGHAGRMIPLAAKLRGMNNNIFIGAGEEHLSLFRKELPGLSYIDFTGYRPRYSGFLPQYLKLLPDTPVLLFHIIREHIRLKKIIREHAIDIVISDNRFGLWNRKITSVYVTHMPRIPFPAAFSFLEFAGVLLHRCVIKKYSFCFIPDLPGELNISGRLSHGIKLPANVRYTGILSRFTDLIAKENKDPVNKRHNTVILSGPEPQKNILKKLLTDILQGRQLLTVFLGGDPAGSESPVQSGSIIFFDHLTSSEMKEVIINSDLIITRAGYSVLMELISLNRSALLIPTPGQTEQEYLAQRLSKMGWFTTISQKKIKDGDPLPSVEPGWPDELILNSRLLLEKALDEMLKKAEQEA